MSVSNRSKIPLSGIMVVAAIGLTVVCCIAGILLFLPGGEETSVEEPPAVSQGIEETEAPMPTKAPPATKAPTATPAPEETEPPQAPQAPQVQAPQGALYVHPKEGFQVLSYGDQKDEGDSYVTFWDDTNTVDVTIFELNGKLTPKTLEDLANDVLKAVLIDTNWAREYQLSSDTPEKIHDGYMVYFFYTDKGGEKQGSLFLRQDDQELAAMTLLTPDFAQMQDTWTQLVSSYQPAGAAAASQELPPQQEGNVVSSGFDVARDGFSFENYGNQRGMLGLTAAEMQRMFGDKVCASVKDNKCVLKPAAKNWMEEANDAMSGGHCEGMAVLSQLFYYEQEQPDPFGAPRTYDLDIRNKDLQREIAYWWVTQSTNPGGLNKVNESPRAVVETLLDSFQKGQQANEWWVVGIYMRDGSGGHAITPIGVEHMGGDRYDILVYDNNWPGEVRRILVDIKRNIWQYQASINPDAEESLYEGDARTRTLEIVAISPRLAQQACTFCSGRNVASTGGGRGIAAQPYYEIYLDGKTDLVITDDQNRSVGYVDGKLVNEIPEATMDTFRFGMDVWDENYEPIYKLPVGSTFGISVIGANITEPTTATVTIIGPGFYMEISDIWLEPGEVDALGVANEGNFFGLSYISNYTETPVISMGIEGQDVSYAFMAQATKLTGEEDALNVGVDLDTGQFVLNSSENKNPGTYDVYVLRLDQAGLASFGTSGLELDPGYSIYLDYANWQTNGQSMSAGVDNNDDGTIDETLELPDTSDEFTWE